MRIYALSEPFGMSIYSVSDPFGRFDAEQRIWSHIWSHKFDHVALVSLLTMMLSPQIRWLLKKGKP